MARINVNVSGVRFEFDRNILEDKKFHRLSQMCNEASVNEKHLEIVVDRPSDSFGAILSYYQTGELHLPPCVCPGQFIKEMEFWDISSDAFADCCSYRYHAFFDELETRQKFQKTALNINVPVFPYVPVASDNVIQKCRRRLWKIIDNEENSLISKIYFGLVMLMVIVSVLSLAYSTEPYLRRSLNMCELIEYMEVTNHKNIDIVKKGFGKPDCSGLSHLINDGKDDAIADTFRSSTGDDDKLEFDVDDSDESATENDEDDNNNTTRNANRKSFKKRIVDIPKVTVPIKLFSIIDCCTLTFFTVDLILRLSTCPAFKLYFMSVTNIFDACASLGSFVYLLLIYIQKENRYVENWVRFIVYIQIFRALRLFRLVRSVRASKVLYYSLRQNMRDISLMAILLLSSISIFSCLIYFIEDRNTIVSIPVAWYWSVVTMTTVGYGDITPKTGFGRFVASICSVCGVLLLAITLPISVNNFLTLYQHSCVNDIMKKKKKEKNKFKRRILAKSDINVNATDAKIKNEDNEKKSQTKIHGFTNTVYGQNIDLNDENRNKAI